LLDARVARDGAAARDAIVATLAETDVEERLRAGGVTEDDLTALRVLLLST
jgi:hypothetical protein